MSRTLVVVAIGSCWIRSACADDEDSELTTDAVSVTVDLTSESPTFIVTNSRSYVSH